MIAIFAGHNIYWTRCLMFLMFASYNVSWEPVCLGEMTNPASETNGVETNGFACAENLKTTEKVNLVCKGEHKRGGGKTPHPLS